ncbi:RHS repeat-associated core domain-containing protein, partial [Aquimonas sp.]|uniref:RHS repeat-associated core domain-containing protein n=1 Tax=Aquimonas sp. TaxID=1872588 RepID=UPI0037C181E5
MPRFLTRSASISCAILLQAGLVLTVLTAAPAVAAAAGAEAQPSTAMPASERPSIVPHLLRGEDTSHLSAAARAERAKQDVVADPAVDRPAGPAAGFVKSARDVLAVIGSSSRTSDPAKARAAAIEQLHAADLLVRAHQQRLPSSNVAQALGLSGLLEARSQDALRRWDSASAAILAAADALQRSPLAKAAQVNLQTKLAALDPAGVADGIYGNGTLPVSRPRLPPSVPDTQLNVAPSYAAGVDVAPQAADLLASGEVRLSRDVLNQAAQLEHSYTRIFDLVRSEVRTEWSAGSTQSVDSTLRRRAGNDVEQASLLIALLRASGAAARYVVGVVEVPVAELAQQIGVPASRVGAALAAAGVPHQPRLSGGRVVAFQLRHIWVSARVPYGNYRGTVADLSEPTWVPLMPALKPASFEPGRPVLGEVALDVREWLRAQLQSERSQLPWPALREQLSAALAAQQPPRALGSLAGSHGPDAAPLHLLPASTPYPVIAVNGEYSELPDEERQWLRVLLHATDTEGAAPLLDARVALSDLQSQRFTLAYQPATVEDQHLANLNGGMGGFPAHLMRLRPSLLPVGLPAQPGQGIVEAGAVHRLEIRLQSPAGELSHSQRLIAGSLAGFAIDAHGDGRIEQPPESGGDLLAGPPAGAVLNQFAQRYLAHWAQADAESAAAFGVRVIRPLPALALALPQVQPEGALGLVERLKFEGVALDAGLRPLEPFSLRDTAGDEAAWLRVSSLHGSALESQQFITQWAVDSISADRALQLAAARGLPVLQLGAASTTDALGAHPARVRTSVAHWLSRGFEVQIPQAPLTLDAWTGSAWRVENPATGESGYFLSGGYAGGMTAVPPGLWYYQDLAEILADPYAEPPNEDPLAAVLLLLDSTAQDQSALAGEPYARPLRVIAIDAQGRPVQGASVDWIEREGRGVLPAAGSAGRVVTLTDRKGAATVNAQAPTSSTGLLWNYLLNAQGRRTRAFLAQVEVMADAQEGRLTTGEDYQLNMLAGPLARLEWVPALGPVDSFVAPVMLGWMNFDRWSYVAPQVQHVNFNLLAYDRYDNPIGAQEVEIVVEDTHSPQCVALADPAIPIIPSAIYTAESACPAGTPLLGQHACLQPELVRYLEPDGALGVSAVPTNMWNSDVRLRASGPGGVEVSRSFHVGAGAYAVLGDSPRCYPFDPPGVIVEVVHPEAKRTTRVGEAFAAPRRFAYYSIGSLPANPRLDPQIFGLTELTQNPFRARGAEVSALRSEGNGWFEFDVVAGAEPAKVELFAEFAYTADGAQTGRYERHISPGWALQLDDPTFSPNPLDLNEFQRTTTDVDLNAPVQPETWRPRISILSDNGAGESRTFCQDVPGKTCVLRRGFAFDATKDRFLQYVVNPGSENPLESARVPLQIGSRIVAAYGSLKGTAPLPELETLFGERFPRSIEMQTEIDVQTDYVCQSGSRFMFAIGQDATVDLEVFALEEDGSRGDSALLAIDAEAFSAGVHETQLRAAELPFGVYEFELRARTDDEDETHSGRLIHREQRRGALPLARSLVKGVDVYDGHAVISAADVAIGGRGPGLRFTRTYASHSGDEPSLLGRGWQSDIEARVVGDTCGSYVVTGAAGQGQRYVPAGLDAAGQPRFRSGNGFHGTFRLVADSPGSFDFFSKDGTRHHFGERSADGTRLSFIEDSNGNRVRYEYAMVGSEHVVRRIADDADRALSFDYQVLRLQRPGPLGLPMTESRTLLRNLQGPEGLRIDYTYHDDGNLRSAVRSGGGSGARTETYEYQDFGALWVRQPGGQSRRYHFGFRLTQARNSSFNSTRDYRWQLGWTGVGLPDGNVMLIPEQRVESLSETDAGTVGFTYQGLRGLSPTSTVVVDARSNASTYRLNLVGATEQLTSPAGTTTTEWDLEHLQPRSVTDVLGAVTTYTYDAHGNRLSESIAHQGNLSRSWTYAPPEAFAVPIKDRVRTAVDARGIPETFAYDARGNLNGRSRGGVGETYGYSARGDRTSRVDGRSELVTYAFDAYGHVTTETDALGVRRGASFDARGRMRSETDGAGVTTEYSYDALDRLTLARHPLGERSTVYTLGGRQRVDTDENRNATTRTYDGQGRLLSETNAADDTRSFSYDDHGNLLSETDFRGFSTTHTYNSANFRVSTSAPLGKSIIYTHDALGHVLTETVSGIGGERRSRFAYAHPLNLRTREAHFIGADAGWAETLTTRDPNGNATRIVDANGGETVQVFDDRDRLTSSTGPEGRRQTFGYDGADQRISETLNSTPPREQGWEFDARGQQIAAIDGTGARWEQGFDGAGRVTQKIDPLGNTVTYSYDAAGRLESESGPRPGQVTTYTLDAVGNRITAASSDGRLITYAYDELNRRESASDGIGKFEGYSYDEAGNIIERTDGLNRPTVSTWNALGYETRRVLPAGDSGPRVLEFSYSVHGDLLSETDANSNTTTHTYDGLGRRIGSTLPNAAGGNTRAWKLDALGNVLEYTDAASRTTLYSYNALNHRTGQRDPSPPGTTQIWVPDVAGNVLSHTDRRGIVHGTTYDAAGRPTVRTRDGLPIETLDYDDAGRVEAVTDARNQTTRYTLDAGGSRLTDTRALGFVQRWTYTPWGGVKTQTDADGLTTRFDYDIRQRLTEQTDPGVGPTTHGYDLANNRTSTERPGNAEWGFDYDGADRLVAVDSPEGHTTVYGYDRHGNRERSQDAAGHATVYRFDARHRLTNIDHPIGGDEAFGHNGEGERTSHTDRSGQTITLSVDGLGRTTARSYSAAAPGDIGNESFQLDGDGRPTQLSQSGGSDGIALTQRRYNGQGWLETETDRYGQRTVWTHDEVGNRTRREDPAGITSYQPDALNRTTAVTVPGAGSTSLDYTPAGRLDTITHPNGASSRYGYDAAGRVETITHSHSGAQVARFEYRYDDRGNRERETRIDGSGSSARTQVTDYGYDRDDRLTETSVLGTDNSITTTTYTLDAVGNRTREEVRRGSTTVSDTRYTYQAHQRLIQTQDSVSGITTDYTYDARGHLITETTNGQTTTYRPNAQDRLATLTLPGAPPVHYSYDAEGKRVERRTNTDVTRFGWDGPTLRRETNAANNVLEAHDWAAGRILASRRLTDTRYAQHDALRSPIRWSRSNGAEAGQLRYDAWGETTASATDLPRIAYTGHYREREGSSYYAQQRYYRPNLGRFNRIDPWEGDVLNPITLNKYLYAVGNPLR